MNSAEFHSFATPSSPILTKRLGGSLPSPCSCCSSLELVHLISPALVFAAATEILPLIAILSAAAALTLPLSCLLPHVVESRGGPTLNMGAACSPDLI